MTIFVVDPNNPLPTDPTISNFDSTKDFIQLSNPSADEVLTYFSYTDYYTLETVGSDTHILTTEGDLVAVIEGVTELKPFTGYTLNGTVYLVSLENEFFSTYIEPSFFEPWYLEQDVSDYGNSVQEAIDAGIVDSAYEHYLKIGQFEGREDAVFFGAEGNSTLYGTGAEPVLIGVPITEAVYARDNVPVTTGEGDIDTLIGSPGGDTFVLGNGTILNDAPQSYYVGGGNEDYALIKGLSGSSVGYPALGGYEDTTIDRLFLAGKSYDYLFEKRESDLHVSTRDGDLIAIIEDAPIMETPFSIPGASYLYGIDNVNAFDALWGASSGFYAPFYFALNPGVEEAIERGEYESAVDHYFKVGQFQEGSEAIFHDTNNEGFAVGYGPSDLLFGVSLTSVDGEQEGWTSATTGVGEQDFFIGGAGVTTYFIGNDNILEPGKAPDVYYLGQGVEDYAFIQSFDPYKDFIFAVGEFADYTFETVDATWEDFGRVAPIKNLEISYQGDLVAVLYDVASSLTVPNLTLQEFSFGDERPGAFAFVAPQNQFLSPDSATYFNEEVYLTLNNKARKAVERGEYASGYEYYLAVGQANGDEAFLSGTNSNDDITAIGDQSTLFGVEVTGFAKVNQKGKKRFLNSDIGEGQIDSLTGNEGKNQFVLGNAGQAFYVGGGDADYANIYNFDRLKDSLIIAGNLIDYTIESVDVDDKNNLEISTKAGDLVAILHDVGDLTFSTRPVDPKRFSGDTLLVSSENRSLQKSLADNFFEPYYAFNNPQAVEAVQNGEYKSVYDYYLNVGRFLDTGIQFTYWHGTPGDDKVTGLGDDIGLFGVEVTTIERQALVPHGIIGIETADTGVGTVDVLIGQGGGGETVYNLGKTGLSSAPNPAPFYVGEGDKDYALIKNFDPLAEEQFISLVGTPSDYTIAQQDGNTRISYHDDLIAIVEGTFNVGVLPFFSRDGRFFLASLDAEGFAESTEFNFYEDLYLQSNPDVVTAIAAGEYTSAFDHYAKTGRYEGREGVIFNGAGIFGGNDIVTDLGGNSEAILIGVPITNIEVDDEEFAFDTANNGEGQKDTLIGTETKELFVLGKNVSLDNPTPISFYVGNGDSDYAAVWSFDETKDRIFLAGASSDYTYESVDGNLQIAKDGDLVAIVDGITELKPYTGSNPEGGTYLLSLENEFFSTYVEPYFYEPIYPVQNPDVVELVSSGQYTSYYDHFLKAGQFELREDTFFVGTEANNILYSLGYESVLVGVPVSQAQYQGGLDVVPLSTGAGSIDTLFGGNTFETIFVLGNSTVLNDTAQSFYVGQGDADYALIKSFGLSDRIFLGSDASLFTQTVVDGNLHISQDNDLIAIVEGKTKLSVDGEELVTPDIEFYTIATAGNDIIYPGSKLNIIGVPLTETADGTVLALTIGVGEFDTLYDKEPADSNSNFYLGLATVDSPDTPQSFYIGQGNADYALIKNFDPIVDHAVVIAGNVDDYEIEIIEGNTHISQDGDLVAIVENVTLLPDIDDGDFTFLYSADDEYYIENSQPFFNESIYLQENPDAADAIAANQFTSGYQHFMRVGLLEGRYAYYNGTSGNDEEIYAMGNSYVLGVAITGFEAATESFTTATTGMGEVDGLTGTVGINEFVLGSKSQSFYIGQGDADYAQINSFDPIKDKILLAGSSSDYSFNAVGENLNISKGGDLVAIVNGITEIAPDALSFG